MTMHRHLIYLDVVDMPKEKGLSTLFFGSSSTGSLTPKRRPLREQRNINPMGRISLQDMKIKCTYIGIRKGIYFTSKYLINILNIF